ncbi:hypothetical protein T492DRAFT_834054 [Pavlovales sp. CCMP2436]|nr:hypothetical protein T492DRAFT_834054 [Pavlovales sp. CCMP2436]
MTFNTAPTPPNSPAEDGTPAVLLVTRRTWLTMAQSHISDILVVKLNHTGRHYFDTSQANGPLGRARAGSSVLSGAQRTVWETLIGQAQFKCGGGRRHKSSLFLKQRAIPGKTGWEFRERPDGRGKEGIMRLRVLGSGARGAPGEGRGDV